MLTTCTMLLMKETVHIPDDVPPDDWMFLVGLFRSPAFKVMNERNKLSREKDLTRHSCGSKSFAEVNESIGRLQEIVFQQQSDKNEHSISADEILTTILGDRTSYVRGKGYGKSPPEKSCGATET